MVSQRRNELIADLFHRGHFVERWGRGISLILSKESTVEFEEIGELFCVTFKRKCYQSQMQHEMKLPEKLPEKLPDIQLEIIQKMRADPKITYIQLADMAGKSKEAIRKNINKLRQMGIINRIGPAKGGHWQVILPYEDVRP